MSARERRPQNASAETPTDAAAARRAEMARRNRSIGYLLASVVVLMAGMAYASVPLYDIFCRVTGFGGTTQRAELAPDAVQGDRVFRVRFNADVSQDLPWSFQPEQNEITLRLGEEKLAFYRAVNESNQPIVGTAVYNVTPQKLGAYFNKVQCFCFTKQRLEPGQAMDFPVSFFVDPEIQNDPNLAEVKTITLSYTFYPDPDDAAARGDGHLSN